MAAFERRAVAHIRENLPEQSAGFSDPQIRERVRDGVRRANRYGLESERQAMCFIDTGFLIGPDFDTRSDTRWARTLLEDRQLSANERAARLLSRAEKEKGGVPPQTTG